MTLTSRVGRQVAQIDPEADQRGLMADHVGARDGAAHRVRVADVPDGQVEIGRQVVRPPVVHGGGQRVQALHLMAGRSQGIDGVGADESRRPP